LPNETAGQGEVYSCSIGCASGKSKIQNLLFHAENTVFWLLGGGGQQPIEILQGDSKTEAFVHAHFGVNALALTLIPKSTDLEDLQSGDLMLTELPVLEKDSGSHEKAQKLETQTNPPHYPS
jgi:hypothetical protein